MGAGIQHAYTHDAGRLHRSTNLYEGGFGWQKGLDVDGEQAGDSMIHGAESVMVGRG